MARQKPANARKRSSPSGMRRRAVTGAETDLPHQTTTPNTNAGGDEIADGKQIAPEGVQPQHREAAVGPVEDQIEHEDKGDEIADGKQLAPEGAQPQHSEAARRPTEDQLEYEDEDEIPIVVVDSDDSDDSDDSNDSEEEESDDEDECESEDEDDPRRLQHAQASRV